MIRICSKCGALLLDSGNCPFCEVPQEVTREVTQDVSRELTREKNRALQPVAAGRTAVAEAAEPEWRREVNRRLEQYRARRRHLNPDEPQSALFSQSVELEIEDDVVEYESAPAPEIQRPIRGPSQRPSQRSVQRSTQKARSAERMEIRVQPELDFAHALDDRAHPQTALVPVAGIGERRWAGILDIFFLGLTCAGFIGLFHSLGGQVTFAKLDAVVYISVLYLFYALYFFLFTAFAAATPGMQLRNLSVVRLDGSLPDSKQLWWRSFGYLLSGATLMLGFIWALWDEDHFTWQDRISHTYITAAAPLFADDAFEISAASRPLAHK